MRGTRKKFGEGNAAIAAYVRRHHPEILDQVLAEEQAFRREGAEKMRAHLAAKVAARKQRKVDALVAQLAALGVHVNGTSATSPSIVNNVVAAEVS